MLLLEDFQLTNPAFLELINSVLSAGEVPGLYTAEELDSLLGPLRDEASDKGHRGPVYTYFAKSKILVRNKGLAGLIHFLDSLFLSSCHEKATEALYIGRILTHVEVTFVSKFFWCRLLKFASC